MSRVFDGRSEPAEGRFAIVVARYNESITAKLLEGSGQAHGSINCPKSRRAAELTLDYLNSRNRGDEAVLIPLARWERAGLCTARQLTTRSSHKSRSAHPSHLACHPPSHMHGVPTGPIFCLFFFAFFVPFARPV